MATRADLQLADEVAKFYADPLGWVMFAFEWDTDPSLQLVELQPPYNQIYDSKYGPDKWACDVLFDLGAKVKERAFDGIHAVDPIREAVASGHGIGKSAFVGWLVNWIMSTRPFAKGTVTANTMGQLSSKTWAEIAKWNRRSITGHWFEVSTGKGAMRMVHKDHPEEWFCNAQTCREENSEAFAGQHAASSTSFYIFDEASGVPNIIDEVSEGGLTDGEPMKFAFGNPTRNSGWFFDAFHKRKHRWSTRRIDSREVQITNKKFIEEMIADYGEDSDLVKVRVRGMFPSLSVMQFISTADVDAAFGRHLRREQYDFAPKILTCDPAWTGEDELVIGLRQGLRFEVLRTLAKNDNDVHVATLLAQLEDEHQADAVVIDFGYGTGIASAGATMGRSWHLANFGSASPEAGCLNLRAYMVKQVRDWLKSGGSIPGDDDTLYNELIAIETVPRFDGVIQLESKEDMRRRGLQSPNRLDALGLSFAIPVMKKSTVKNAPREYDPVTHLAGALNSRAPDYDPLETYTRR